ncbi:MAG: FAD-binding oxidoreductase, partial [Myxococcales bacterium]|nr:FAD-binding oxidoreductase [Myxococcales bacterium]
MATDAPKIGPGDPRYDAVLAKQFNKRFRARPDHVRPAGSTEQVIASTNDAIAEGRRLVVTSGGHCLENFVSDPGVQVILDVSPMKRVYHDAEMGAVAVEAGATVGEAFRALHERWGVVVPFGEYPGIGTGGHVAGGAFGFLCRQLGLAADYLHAVEVVTVAEDGRARATVAKRDRADPNHDLWWAHTGGGAGNFGIVTRHWFRAPTAKGDDPAALLPRSPQTMTTFRGEWSWSDLDRDAFVRLARNFGVWCERNSADGAPGTSLWALLEL